MIKVIRRVDKTRLKELFILSVSNLSLIKSYLTNNSELCGLGCLFCIYVTNVSHEVDAVCGSFKLKPSWFYPPKPSLMIQESELL